MAVIELGDRTGPAADEQLARSPRMRRPALVSLALALVVVGLSGGAPAPRPLPEATVPARLGSLVVTAGDRLFVADPITDDPTLSSVPEIASYTLPDARPLTRARLVVPFARPVEVLARVGDILLVTSWQENPQEVAAVDGRTGVTRWHQIARLEGVTVGGDVLLGPPLPPPGPSAAGETLRAVDPTTGAERWSYAYPAGTVRTTRLDRLTGQVSLLADRLPSGRLQVRDPASGRVVRETELPPTAPDAPATATDLQLAGDLVLAGRDDGGVTAYGTDRLDRRWTASVPIERAAFVDDCDTVICRTGPRGGTDAVDPATGRILWRSDRWTVRAEYAGRVVAVAADDGRLGDDRITVLDARTGNLLADLGRWRVVGPAPDGRRLYGLRVGLDGRALVAALSPADGSVRVLTVLRSVSGDCRSRDGVLICRRLDGHLAIWALP